MSGHTAAILEKPTLPEKNAAWSGPSWSGGGHVIKLHQRRLAEAGSPNPSALHVSAGVNPGRSVGHLGLPPTSSAIYKEVETASNSVLYRGQKTALPAQIQLRTGASRGYPCQETAPHWSSLTSLGCYPTHHRHTLVLSTILLRLLLPYSSAGWCLLTAQVLLAALHGPLEAHVVSAFFNCFRRP